MLVWHWRQIYNDMVVHEWQICRHDDNKLVCLTKFDLQMYLANLGFDVADLIPTLNKSIYGLDGYQFTLIDINQTEGQNE